MRTYWCDECKKTVDIDIKVSSECKCGKIFGYNYNPKKGKPTGRIRKGVKEVTLTEGGAYAAYDKKSKPAGKFRKAFSKAKKAGKKTFKWDGRSYTTKTK